MDGERADAALGQELAGGMANAGTVRRLGSAVERPAPPHMEAIHTHLRALAERGFDGAPHPLGPGPHGRERLRFIPGEVALPPFPRWALTEAALRSVGTLLRRLHEVSAPIPVDPSVRWPTDLSDPEGGTLLCHNDVCMENVVFRDGRAVAVLDFDLMAPGRPLWDVAMTARYWVPMLDPVSAAVNGLDGLDPGERLRVLADAYGLGARDRAALPGVIEQATAVGRAFVTARVDRGEAPFVRALSAHGGWERWDRLQSWQRSHRAAFEAALRS